MHGIGVRLGANVIGLVQFEERRVGDRQQTVHRLAGQREVRQQEIGVRDGTVELHTLGPAGLGHPGRELAQRGQQPRIQLEHRQLDPLRPKRLCQQGLDDGSRENPRARCRVEHAHMMQVHARHHSQRHEAGNARGCHELAELLLLGPAQDLREFAPLVVGKGDEHPGASCVDCAEGETCLPTRPVASIRACGGVECGAVHNHPTDCRAPGRGDGPAFEKGTA